MTSLWTTGPVSGLHSGVPSWMQLLEAGVLTEVLNIVEVSYTGRSVILMKYCFTFLTAAFLLEYLLNIAHSARQKRGEMEERCRGKDERKVVSCGREEKRGQGRRGEER